MAKNPGIRKTIELLLKKVETLENQSFAQKLAIDELENKLQLAEALIKQVQDNPFGPISAPNIIWPAIPPPLPPPPQVTQPQWAPSTVPSYTHTHVCAAGVLDWTGATYCAQCGAYMSGPSWTVTSTSDKTTLCLADPASQSSTDVEDTLEFDIHVDPESIKIK